MALSNVVGRVQNRGKFVFLLLFLFVFRALALFLGIDIGQEHGKSIRLSTLTATA